MRQHSFFKNVLSTLYETPQAQGLRPFAPSVELVPVFRLLLPAVGLPGIQRRYSQRQRWPQRRAEPASSSSSLKGNSNDATTGTASLERRTTDHQHRRRGA